MTTADMESTAYKKQSSGEELYNDDYGHEVHGL